MDTGPSAAHRAHAFNYELVTFQIEDTPYTVPRYGFEKWSRSLFPDMFALPQGVAPGSVEGTSAENPICVPDCTPFEFESLLQIIYPSALALATLATYRDLAGSAFAMEKDQMIGALKLSRMWDMPAVSILCVQILDGMDLTASEKVSLGKRFRNQKWLLEGYTSLIENPTADSFEHLSSSVGWEALARILWVGTQLRESVEIISDGWGVREGHVCCKTCKKSPGDGQSKLWCHSCQAWKPCTIAVGTVVPEDVFKTSRAVTAVQKKLEEVFQAEFDQCIIDKLE